MEKSFSWAHLPLSSEVKPAANQSGFLVLHVWVCESLQWATQQKCRAWCLNSGSSRSTWGDEIDSQLEDGGWHKAEFCSVCSLDIACHLLSPCLASHLLFPLLVLRFCQKAMRLSHLLQVLVQMLYFFHDV